MLYWTVVSLSIAEFSVIVKVSVPPDPPTETVGLSTENTGVAGQLPLAALWGGRHCGGRSPSPRSTCRAQPRQLWRRRSGRSVQLPERSGRRA